MEMSEFITRMYESDNQVFILFDGWTSHSYPNPNFSGSVYGEGKGSIRSYLWETSFTQKYGLRSRVPIFITETGWADFDHFSWKESKTDGFYPQYDIVAKIPKIEGEPEQIKEAKFDTKSLPDKLVSDSFYTIRLLATNTGQSIWNESEKYTLTISGNFQGAEVPSRKIPTTEPLLK